MKVYVQNVEKGGARKEHVEIGEGSSLFANPQANIFEVISANCYGWIAIR